MIHEVLGDEPVARDEENIPAQKKPESNSEIVHELSNLLGIIRNKCENFTLSVEDGVYKNKSQEELVKMAVEIMKDFEGTVDRAMKAVEKIPKSSGK